MQSEIETSLWHQSAGPAPAYAPLDQDLDTDLLIIGGGFTGCSAALEAASLGAKVALIEARTIGYGGSGRNVGLVNAGLWLSPEVVKSRLGTAPGTRLCTLLLSAPDTAFQTIADYGIACEATRNGTLHLAHSRAGFAGLAERHRQLAGLGYDQVLLSAQDTAHRTGSSGFHGALFDPRAGTINPLSYCRGLASAAHQKGANLFETTRAEALSHDGQWWTARANGRRVRARRVILATNGYHVGVTGVAAPSCSALQYCQFSTDPLTPEQRQGVLPGAEGCWDTALVMSSYRIDAAGRFIIGGIGHLGGIGEPVHRRWAERKLARTFPQLAGCPLTQAWDGTIAVTRDHIPKLVQFGPSAVAVFGYSGRGIGPGTVFGTSVARHLLGGGQDDLPLALTSDLRDRFAPVRSAYYRYGALLAHWVGARGPLR